ncbi:pseudouridine-5'-phosphate glycosidase [Anaerotignum neopropionicum]|uniref:Pseudouridine-5'-phosphate glycosidase n=1 Tax=Anaerotignum neopropionicum TaxID=36847 RepID=A0A136WFV4_9FIRM|nr:pseudouridine-5'-phosphate glycosidase [Anaerotignum neopropionicum]KXL53249.1 pseudouridine-5'-phosphate glycosidase [Anaerotignum neopropionicum]
MNLEKYLTITPEIQEAIKSNKPIVALESTILSHGMPYPENVVFAHKVEDIVRKEGAIPATTAIIGGKLKVGLTADELEIMCKGENIGKVSRRDVAVYLATEKAGATTVATTMMIAAMAGIRIFATGGIGGVHRGAAETMDISADLQELAHTPVAVVGAGAKSLLDIGLTLEYLETMGVPVIGVDTDDFPAFYCRKSGYKVDFNAKDEKLIARILKTKWDLDIEGGALIANPIPTEYELDFDEMEGVINRALELAKEQGIRGKETTPFLLKHIKDMTEGVSFASNLQLAYNNAKVASKIAVEYAKLS